MKWEKYNQNDNKNHTHTHTQNASDSQGEKQFFVALFSLVFWFLDERNRHIQMALLNRSFY